MNFFLFINRYLIIFSASIIIIFFLAIIFSKQFNYKKNELEKSDKSISNADISEPKFAINNIIIENNSNIFLFINKMKFNLTRQS